MFPPFLTRSWHEILHTPLSVFIPYKYYPSGHSILLAPLYYSFTILDTLTYYNPYISNNTPHYPFIRPLGSIPGCSACSHITHLIPHHTSHPTSPISFLITQHSPSVLIIIIIIIIIIITHHHHSPSLITLNPSLSTPTSVQFPLLSLTFPTPLLI